MARGGAREGAGAKIKHGKRVRSDKIELKRILHDAIRIIHARMRELERRGEMEGAKQELTKLSMQVLTLGLPHVVPKLQAVMGQTETTIRYVARLPSPMETIDEWQEAVKALPSK
jgi:hypothetical protein